MREFVRQDQNVPAESENGQTELAVALSRLSKISRLMKMISFFIGYLTLMNFVLLATILIVKSSLPANEEVIAKAFSLLLAPASLLLVLIYARQRKDGDSLFEEISDELEWNIRSQRASRPSSKESPALAARLQLREFVEVSDLPLVPGRFGPAIYLGTNLLLLLVQQYFFSIRP